MENKPIDGAPRIKFNKAIMEKGTDTVVFSIPDSKDEKEKECVLKEQIVKRLVSFSNIFNSYDQAIEECQGYLKALLTHYPEEAELVRKTADLAGAEFLKIVAEAKKRAFRTTIERGEMFLGVKDISGGGHGDKKSD